VPLKGQPEQNRLCGARFERALEHFARIEGMLVVRQPLAFRYRAGGKAVAMRAELDYALVTPHGQVAYVDTKSWAQKSYPRSALTLHQVARAYTYNRYKVPSGFIVEFRAHDAVVFFSGFVVQALAKGRSLGPDDGLFLGSCRRFSPGALFDERMGVVGARNGLQ
jgi:hypothetical protein